MSLLIYGIIIILFLVCVFWTWNNTKSFESTKIRIVFIVLGIFIITILTNIVFLFSRIGIKFPHQEMIGKVRNIILLVFVPINGFVLLPQIASTIGKIKKDDITNEQFKKRFIVFILSLITIIIFECFYFKSIQNGIIRVINLR